MTDSASSVWLGPLRRPVRNLAIALIGLTLLIGFWVILTPSEGTAVLQVVPSLGKPVIQAFLIALTSALFMTAVYLSDRVGAIEVQPTGPMDLLSLVLSRVAMLGVIAVVCIMFYEVISRYVFVKPTLWANELSLWIAAFIFLLAGLYAMQQRSHIRIYIIYDVMPRWMRKVCDVISLFLIWFFCFAMIWGSFNEARDKLLRMETFGTAWDPPIPATVKTAMLIIISLVALQALSNLIADWRKEPKSHSPMDDIDEVEIENIRRTVQK
ncbi:TRAP transporter small permease subunit [Seohaeicola nanhaiensis]|uniref:TRAP transporter small permease protein n=1 Tax=Seohaeicola nanhaiensis TaxID=1387282 RepID=A0ABV9KND7_9RHOB